MKVRIHALGWKGSRSIEDSEEPTALFNGVVEVDGVVIEEATTMEVVFSGGGLATVKLHLIPGSFEVVTHTSTSWKKMLEEIDRSREDTQASDGTGRLIASVE